MRLAGPPGRIVSLVPSVTEILFAIGAEERLVGVTDFCDFPAAARRKPSVGGMIAPDFEVLVGLRPDLVVAPGAGIRHETFLQLERLGIPVYLANPSRLEDVMDLIRRLGGLAGRDRPAQALIGALRERIRAVAGLVATRPRPRVLYVLWPEPLVVPGERALVSELIGLAGGASVTASAGAGYPRLSLEAAVAANPEVILLASHSDRHGKAPSPWARLESLPAVKAGRLHAVDGDLLHRYGPRIVDGLELLARLIHPEAFGGVAR